VSSHAAAADEPVRTRSVGLPGVGTPTISTVALGTLLAALALQGQGGLQLGPLTGVEIALEVTAGLVGAAALLVAAPARRAHGAVTLGLFAALVVLTALSISWAGDPGDAWIETNRTLAWFAAFALGVALVRLWPEGWSIVLGALAFAAVEVCGYAVLTKVFPADFNPGEIYARLREPFGYWNSVGLMAAMGVPACLWLGARRTGHAAVNALAFPATSLLVLACLLAYSRGALLALGAGCIFWFATVPLRLRGAAVLAVGGLGGLAAAVWAFGVSGLSADRIALDARVAAGHKLGILVVALLLVELVAGLAIGFALAEQAPSLRTRRMAGLAALVCIAMVPVVLVAELATSQRGLGGSVSKAWTDLTDPDATPPANDPTRLAAVGSVRARYWDEALKIWRANEAVGAGAGGYRTARPRYRRDTLNVRHAHGYVVQTMADLGLVGLAVSLALLAAWIASAARATGPWRRAGRGSAFSPERAGLLTMCAVVVVFGVHSFVDWTWFVPGNAVPALILAGWVSGCCATLGVAGAASSRAALRSAVRSPVRLGAATAAVVVAGLAAWATWQPQRSVNASDAALVAVEDNRLPAARADVRRARDVDPLATTPLYVGATVETAAGNPAGARRLYQEAVRLAPATAEPWLRLAQFELDEGDSRAALRALGPALFLDPSSSTVRQTYVTASRQETARRAAAAERAKRRRAARRGGG
jgi:tetratricopeptide (TPR) repeat protein